MNPMIAVGLRAAALVALTYGMFTLVDLASGDVIGANIGAGLFSFAALALAAGGGGLVDGRLFRLPLRRILLTWAAVAVVVALVLPATAQGLTRFDASVYLDDVAVLGVFYLALVLTPAAVGAVTGSLLRGNTDTSGRPPIDPLVRPRP